MQRTIFLLLLSFCLRLTAVAADSFVYIGTYTNAGGEGIYAYRFNPDTGELKPLGVAAKTSNPSFLTISPNGKFLYAANEDSAATVSGFALNRNTGALTPINQSSTRGNGACFVAVDHTNRALLVANYGSGSVASFHIDDSGKLSQAVSFIEHKGSSANAARQKTPHAHSINLSPDNRFAIAADLGTDEVKVYKFDAAAATLEPNDPPSTKLTPGDGPRHFTFHPNHRFGYVINELHSTVTALAWDAQRGVLTPIESVSTLPAGFKGDNSTAEVQVHPSGKWLYGSNRGNDSIAVMEIDHATGKLKLVQNAPTGGSTPRNFRMDPTGKWLLAANQKGNNMTLFKVDQQTGFLTATGASVPLNSPVCVKFITAK